MSRQVSRGSAGEYHSDKLAGVAGLLLASIRQMSGQGSQGSICAFQADQRAGVPGLRWRVSGRCAGRSRAAPLVSIRQMSGQVWRDSPGEYQAEDRKSTRLNSSHQKISYAVFCLKKKSKRHTMVSDQTDALRWQLHPLAPGSH